MKQNKQLPQLRISTEVYNKIIQALNKMNEDSDIEFSLSDFRRLSYKYFSEFVLSKGVSFVVKV